MIKRVCHSSCLIHQTESSANLFLSIVIAIGLSKHVTVYLYLYIGLLICFLANANCDEERRSVVEFMLESIVFCSTRTMSSLKQFT